MLDTLVGTLNHDLASQQTGCGVGGEINKRTDGARRIAVDGGVTIVANGNRVIIVLDIALGHKASLRDVSNVGNRSVSIDQLINLITFELEATLFVSIGIKGGSRDRYGHRNNVAVCITDIQQRILCGCNGI